MIEIAFDTHFMEQQLTRLNGAQRQLGRAVKAALMSAVPEIRAEVIGVLQQDITVGNKFVRRAVKAVRHLGEHSEFKVFSKSLFLDDYELEPRTQTARTGTPSKNWPGFTYKLRSGGKSYHSFGTLTGSDGSGSTPFIARTQSGNLRVMYRRNTDRAAEDESVFLAYAPPIQYHAAAPHVEDAARVISRRIFHAALARAVDGILAGRAV